VSVVIDRLGYGASLTKDAPDGFELNYCSQATIVAQVIDELHRGAYWADGLPAYRYRRVALAGLSGGGLVASFEAWNFRQPVLVGTRTIDGHIDALALMSYSEAVPINPIVDAQQIEHPTLICGQTAVRYPPTEGRTSPTGYVYLFGLGTDPDRQFLDDSVSAEKNNAMLIGFTQGEYDANVVTDLLNHVQRDPCGEPNSYTNDAESSDIEDYLTKPAAWGAMPVLLYYGQTDQIFTPDARAFESALVRLASSDVTTPPDEPLTGHVMIFHNAPVAMSDGELVPSYAHVQATVSAWLTGKGF
jgi:pimeloyl-ACP methyl ester carboxylesterase